MLCVLQLALDVEEHPQHLEESLSGCLRVGEALAPDTRQCHNVSIAAINATWQEFGLSRV